MISLGPIYSRLTRVLRGFGQIEGWNLVGFKRFASELNTNELRALPSLLARRTTLLRAK